MMKGLLLTTVVAILCGCTQVQPASTPPPATQPPAPTEPTSKPPIVGVEPLPPTNIGDGSAIEFTSWHGTRKGEGTLTNGSQKQPIEVANLGFEADGKFLIVFQKLDLPDARYAGTWQKGDPKSLSLHLTQIAGTDQDVTGTLKFMDRANPSELTFEGKNAKGEPLTVKFRMGG